MKFGKGKEMLNTKSNAAKIVPPSKNFKKEVKVLESYLGKQGCQQSRHHSSNTASGNSDCSQLDPEPRSHEKETSGRVVTPRKQGDAPARTPGEPGPGPHGWRPGRSRPFGRMRRAGCPCPDPAPPAGGVSGGGPQRVGDREPHAIDMSAVLGLCHPYAAGNKIGSDSEPLLDRDLFFSRPGSATEVWEGTGGFGPGTSVATIR